MCKVWGLRLGSNFGMQLAADKNFYLRLTFKEMRGFVVFIEKYLAAIWLISWYLRPTLQIQELKFNVESLK